MGSLSEDGGITKLSELNIDADLAMGAHNITLGAAQTVDGKDVGGLISDPASHSNMSNRTRKVFVPTSAAAVTAAAHVMLGDWDTVDWDGIGEAIHVVMKIPDDFVSYHSLKLVYVGLSGGQGDFEASWAAVGEVYNIHSEDSLNVALAVSGANQINETLTGLDLETLAKNDYLGVTATFDSGDFRVLGFLLQYVADM